MLRVPNVVFNKTKILILLLIVLMWFAFSPQSEAFAATSPTLSGSSGYSVLGGAEVTNTGTTHTTGAVGVSPGTSLTGTETLTADGGTHINDASAIAAQADISTAVTGVWTALDQDCTATYPDGTDLTDISPLVPGVYCSEGSFLLTGNLTLTGSSGVWIFKTASTLITSSGSSVTGGDPCNVWWRIGSAATFGTTTSFIGNVVIADTASVTAMNTGATLNGRILAQAAATVTLDANTISGPTCTAASTDASTAGSTSGGSSSSSGGGAPCIADEITTVPLIIESRRIDADSIFISWGPYAGINTFNVRYGLEDGKWLYNTSVTGFSTTINGLPPNQPIWIQVAATNNCAIGAYGASRLVGGPGLPNTGLAPRQNNIPWYIPTEIFVGVSILLVLIQRKHRFLSKP